MNLSKKFLGLIFGALTMANFLNAEPFNFSIGPFNIQFPIGGGSMISSASLENPICRGIRGNTRLELILEGSEVINEKEKKFVVKKLIVEPYVFGMTKKEPSPFLRGNVVEEVLIEEVTVKSGEPRFEEDKKKPSEIKGPGFFAGLFRSDKDAGKNIDIRKVVSIKVLEGQIFETPKDYKPFSDDTIQVLCQVSLEAPIKNSQNVPKGW